MPLGLGLPGDDSSAPLVLVEGNASTRCYVAHARRELDEAPNLAGIRGGIACIPDATSLA
jgi:hypothetical protein